MIFSECNLLNEPPALEATFYEDSFTKNDSFPDPPASFHSSDDDITMNSDFWLDDAAVNQKGTLPNVNDFFKGLPSTPAPVRVKKVTPLSSPDTTAHLTATSSMSDHPSSGSRSMTESLPKPSNRALATWEELTSRVHSKQATGPFPAAFSDSFSTDQQDPTPNHRGSSSPGIKMNQNDWVGATSPASPPVVGSRSCLHPPRSASSSSRSSMPPGIDVGAFFSTPVPDTSNRDRRTMRRQPQLPRPDHQTLRSAAREDDDMQGSDHFVVDQSPSSALKSPPLYNSSSRHNRRLQTPKRNLINSLPPSSPCQPASSTARVDGFGNNTDDSSGTNTSSSSRPAMPRSFSDNRNNYNNEIGTNASTSVRKTVTRSNSDQQGLVVGGDTDKDASQRHPKGLLAASPKDTKIQHSHKRILTRSTGSERDTLLNTIPTTPSRITAPPTPHARDGTPAAISTPFRSFRRGLPLGSQMSPPPTGNRNGGLGDPNHRGSASKLSDLTTASPRHRQISRGRRSGDGPRRNSRSKSRETRRGHRSTIAVDHRQPSRSKSREASKRRHRKIQKDLGMSKKDDPLLALYASPETTVQSPKASPGIMTTKAEEKVDGPGEAAVLTQELWSPQDMGHRTVGSPLPRSQASPTTEKKVVSPSRLTVISPQIPVQKSQTQESKDRRSDVYRSLKDLLKADKKNLKVEIQADGTKRLVVDLSDLDTVFGGLSVPGIQR